MPIYQNVNGVWKTADRPCVNVGGVWKIVNNGYVNVSGTWKLFYTKEPDPNLPNLYILQGSKDVFTPLTLSPDSNNGNSGSTISRVSDGLSGRQWNDNGNPPTITISSATSALVPFSKYKKIYFDMEVDVTGYFSLRYKIGVTSNSYYNDHTISSVQHNSIGFSGLLGISVSNFLVDGPISITSDAIGDVEAEAKFLIKNVFLSNNDY